MSKTTIVEHLRGSNPFAPDYLTAEIGHLSCGFRDGSWTASSFTNGDIAEKDAYRDIRYEMEMAMDGLQVAFLTHEVMLGYFKEHAHEVRKPHAYSIYHMWLAGKYANYRITLRANTNMVFCLSIIALRSVV